jgi:hypothetical protein
MRARIFAFSADWVTQMAADGYFTPAAFRHRHVDHRH